MVGVVRGGVGEEVLCGGRCGGRCCVVRGGAVHVVGGAVVGGVVVGGVVGGAVWW